MTTTFASNRASRIAADLKAAGFNANTVTGFFGTFVITNAPRDVILGRAKAIGAHCSELIEDEAGEAR